MVAAPLAFDLVEGILFHLRYDTSALRACSYVAKSWVAPCQKHLFSRVTLSSEKAAARLGCVLQDTPWLVNWVRELQIERNADDPVLIHDAIGTPLPSLELLKLTTNVTFNQRGNKSLSLPYFASVQAMDVVHANFFDLDQLRGILSQFQHMSSFCFSFRTEWAPAMVATMIQPPCHLRLRHLSLVGLIRADVLLQFSSWMGGGKPSVLPGVEVLELNVGALDLISLDRCAPTLRELRIRQFGTTWNELLKPLPHLPALTTLVMNAFDRHANRSKLENIMGDFRVAAPALSNIRITASVVQYPGAPASTLRWERLYSFMLGKSSHPLNLESVTLTIPKSRKEEISFLDVITIVENEAMRVKDYDQVISGDVRLFLHVFDAEGNEVERRLGHAP